MSQPSDDDPGSHAAGLEFAPVVEAAAPRGTVRRLAWIPVVIAVLLVSGVAVLVKHGSSAASGGAASPEAAVRQGIDAITHQDVARLFSLVNPGEVRSLSSLVSVARQKASKSGLVRATGVPEPWLSLTASGITLTTETPRKGLAFVTLAGGTISSTVDEAKMPDALRPQNPRAIHGGIVLAPPASGGSESRYGHVPALFQVVGTVEENGRWYISPTTTVLEDFRRAVGLPEPNFDDPTPLDGGASSPEDVLSGLASAIEDHDLRRAAGYISSKDVPGISYYYGSFAAQLDLVLRFVDTKVSDIDVSVEPMSNGLQKVVIHGFSAALRTPGGGGGSLRYTSGCVTTPDSERPSCSFGDILRRYLGVDQPFVVVEQNKGKWQISPVATALEYLRIFLTAGDMNATYLRFGIPQFSPVVATLRSDSSATVQVNAAGYAHVILIATPNGCVDVETDGSAFVEQVPYGSSPDTVGCPNIDDAAFHHQLVRIPESGSVDLILYDPGSGVGSVAVRVKS